MANVKLAKEAIGYLKLMGFNITGEKHTIFFGRDITNESTGNKTYPCTRILATWANLNDFSISLLDSEHIAFYLTYDYKHLQGFNAFAEKEPPWNFSQVYIELYTPGANSEYPLGTSPAEIASAYATLKSSITTEYREIKLDVTGIDRGMRM